MKNFNTKKNKKNLILNFLGNPLLVFLSNLKTKSYIRQKRRIDSQKGQISEKNPQNKKRFRQYLIILLILSALIAVVFFMYRQRMFENELFYSVSYFDNKCDDIYIQSPLITFLLIDDIETKKQAFLYVISKTNNTYYVLDISNIEFIIDNFGNKGKIHDFIRRNTVYLVKEKLLSAIKYFVINQMNIKVDFVVYSRNEAFYVFINHAKDLWQQTFFLSNSKYDFDNEYLLVDVCEANFKYVVSALNSYSKKLERKINLISDIDLMKIIDNLQIKKEQVRISIHGYAGVSYLPDKYREILSNYGLNVVSVDIFEEQRNKTKILVRNNYIDSYTLSVIKYLMSLNQNKVEIEINDKIFSEIQIELGSENIF
ncbi:MAG: hypothetical protein N3A71_01275 [Candidatus Dojkabacteria bacterium]|nr:hypothetical protein [Candidatus Dojkabacteria bacterium]